MSSLSDHLMGVAIVLYTVAMLCHAVEYAFGKQGVVARVATRAHAMAGGPSDPPPVAPERPRTDRAVLAGRAAVGFTILGVLAHAGMAVTRGIAAGRVPWGNMYEFIAAGCLIAVLVWLGVAIARPALRQLGLFVLLFVILLLGLASTVLYVAITPLMPALNSYWLVIHVFAATSASGIFLVGFVTASMYLIRQRYDKVVAASEVPESELMLRFPMSLGARLPAADVLERLTFRLHVFGFPVWTFAGICGAIWAEAAWGRYWGWDPKETWLFISWVVYACYLHARATPSVKRTVTAWIVVLGWLTMMMNLFGVNLFLNGFHSYSGL